MTKAFLEGIAVGFAIGVGLMSAIFEFYRQHKRK